MGIKKFKITELKKNKNPPIKEKKTPQKKNPQKKYKTNMTNIYL